MTVIDPDFPHKKFLKRIEGQRRGRVSTLFQLRANHIPLNHYLYRFKCVESAGCPHCGDMETVRHFIFKCPAYARERHRMHTRIGRASSSLKGLMESERGLDELVKYIAQTKRFDHF
ncbi:hypothetical protein DL96DRAFT_1465676 [Flagelloscypha sp. PMI_526]|nr:hypothetical protein DL96DRAFT_1465676 [Flagelloscypha sp. PMI_526]